MAQVICSESETLVTAMCLDCMSDLEDKKFMEDSGNSKVTHYRALLVVLIY